MKRVIILLFSFLSVCNLYSQNTIVYQSGITGAENLKAIENMGPYTAAAVGFDTRYEGIKGTTRLFDTLFASSLLLRGQTSYIRLNSDLDIVNNSLVFKQSGTGELMEIPSDVVAELIVNKEDKTLIFRNVKEISFKDKIEGNKFYQVLKESPNKFIRIPEKKFIKADYGRVYGPDIRYDELKLIYKYYIEDSGNIFQRVQLNEKSLAKQFPDKKELIYRYFEENPDGDIEEKVISILNQF